MAVIVDFEVPADHFALGRLFGAFPDIEVELERMIPVDSGVVPLLWVSRVEVAAVERELRDDPLVEDVTVLTRTEERSLIEVEWNPAVDGIVQPMMRNGVDLLRGSGDAEAWTFHARFLSRDQLASFRDDCLDHGVGIDLLRIYDPRSPTENRGLSEAQVDALLLSHEAGYWSIPRETDLVTLGERLGISDTAVSQRLRRGVDTLIREYVVPEAGRERQ